MRLVVPRNTRPVTTGPGRARRGGSGRVVHAGRLAFLDDLPGESVLGGPPRSACIRLLIARRTHQAFPEKEGLQHEREHPHRADDRPTASWSTSSSPSSSTKVIRNWVPPFIEERRDFFDPKKNPFFEHARFQLFLARRDGELVGTIGAVVNDNQNSFHEEKSGGWGFFECVNDPAVADALFDVAEAWVHGQGMTVIRGPLSFSTNDECGTAGRGLRFAAGDHDDLQPALLRALVEAAGFRKAKDLLAFHMDLARSRWIAWAASRPRSSSATQQRLPCGPAQEHCEQRPRQVIKEVYNAPGRTTGASCR